MRILRALRAAWAAFWWELVQARWSSEGMEIWADELETDGPIEFVEVTYDRPAETA